tara:strand:- start:282 stop:401 length:120 start_codon:yes stop_codon:yes gene_type:complete
MITGKDIKEAIGMVIFTILIFNAPELIQKYGKVIELWAN